MKRILYLFAAFLPALAWGQAPPVPSYSLTLEESIAIAKGQSYTMKSLEQDLIVAQNNLKASLGQLRTSVSMNLTIPQYTETVREWEDESGISFFPVKTLRASTGLTITQPLPTDGSISVSSGLVAINDYYTDRRSSTLNTRIRLLQPIDALYGYNNIRSSIKRARLDYERSTKNIKREDLNLVYSVSNAYYRLLSQEKGTEIARMNLERQNEAYEISKNKYAAGLIREVEALQMEVDLADAQNSYDMALQDLGSSRNTFKQLLGLESNAEVTLRADLRYQTVTVDADKAVAIAISKRLEIREREIQVELQRLNVRQRKAQRMPKISLDAYYERTGISNLDISDPFNSTMSNTWTDLRRRPSNYGVGIVMTVPIFDWGRNKANVVAAEASMKQNKMSRDEEVRTIETEVRNLAASQKSALARLQLLEKSVVIAEKSFAITLQRFSDGDIDSQALALERNRLNAAQKSHLEAFISYQLSLADLMRKTFYDFANDRAIE